MPQCFPFEEENVAVEEDISSEDHETSKLIVFNDNVNTFEWVIECFVKVLRHSHEQAEQLSYMIHFNGKAIVKEGSLEALRPKKDALLERGLSAVIES
jgi:ATP-dependent Clp protease adaptor protein ClpS